MIQVLVGAGDPVRGPHPIRASGRSVKDDSSPVRGPHPVRASGQEKEIQGGMVGKEERGAEARCWRSQTSDPRRPALKALPNLSLNVLDKLTLRATRAK